MNTFHEFQESDIYYNMLESYPLPVAPKYAEQMAAVYYTMYRAISGESTMLSLEAGQGKTYIALMVFQLLREHGFAPNKLLFCVPNNNTLTNIASMVTAYTKFSHVVLESSDGITPFMLDDVDIIITSYPTLIQSHKLLKPVKGAKGKMVHSPNVDIVASTLSYVVLDEAHNLKNHEAQNFSTMDYLINRTDRLLTFSMSATLVVSPDNLINIWALAKLVDNGAVFGSTFHEFSEESGLFHKEVKKVHGAAAKFKKYVPQIVKYVPTRGAKDKIEAALSSMLIRYDIEKAENALDTSVQIGVKHVQMNDTVNIMYQQLLEKYRSQTYTAESKAVLQKKLLQLSAGIHYVRVEEGTNEVENMLPYELCSKAIYLQNNLKDIVEGSEGKILIYHEHVACSYAIQSACHKADIPLITITSEQNTTQKKQLRDMFVNDPKFRVLCTSYRLGSESINFADGNGDIVVNGVICFEITHMKALFYQAIGRLDRIGQKHATWCEILVASEFEEKWVESIKKYRMYKLGVK